MKYLLIKNVNVVTGKVDEPYVPNVDVLIADGIIKTIDQNINVKASKVIDGSNKFLLPGFINMHVHLPSSGKPSKKKVSDQAKLVDLISNKKLLRPIGVMLGKKYALVELKSGVTTLRAVGGVSNFDALLRDKIKAGKVIGPRLVVANQAIGPLGCHMQGTVAVPALSVEEAVALVKKQIDAGADIVKLMITSGILDAEEVGNPGYLKMPFNMAKACVDEAHKYGKKVAAHVEGEEGMQVAIEAGVDTIEHTSYVDDKYLTKLKAYNGAVICTISPAVPFVEIDMRAMGYSDDDKLNAEIFMSKMLQNIRNCLDKGIHLGLGTDTACPYVTHYDFWRELVNFKKYFPDVSNAQIISLATLENAKILGLDDQIGSIEENKIADLVLFGSNPLDNLSACRNPLLVISGGRLVKPNNKKYQNVEKVLDSIVQ